MTPYALVLVSALATAGPAAANEPDHHPAPAASETAASPAAQQYLAHALALLQRGYLRRDAISWPVLRAHADAALAGAQTEADAYTAVRFVIESLNDPHAAFHEPGQRERDAETTQPPVSARVLDGGIGYLYLPRFSGPVEHDTAIEYATRAHRLLTELAAQAPCGWVVDLRDNAGGNMWPMLAAAGPLLGTGAVGAHIGVTAAERANWHYNDGAVTIHAGNRRNTRIRVDAPAPDLSGLPVAVLLSGQTASAAEAVAIAFIERPGARSFGTPTAGLASGNAAVSLPDGALLVFPFGYSADRNGNIHDPGITPDVVTDDAGTPVPASALEWLRSHGSCR